VCVFVVIIYVAFKPDPDKSSIVKYNTYMVLLHIRTSGKHTHTHTKSHA